MKNFAASTVMAMLCLASPCLAENGWLLLNDSRQHVLFRGIGSELRQIAVLGDRTIYGVSDDAVAIASRGTGSQNGALWVFDRKTEQLQWKWPIAAYPQGQLSGPSSTVVITDGTAFFPAILQSPDGTSLAANELGGSYDLYAVELMNGSVKRLPIPKDCSNPQLLTINQTVLVYPWNGSDLWVLDKGANNLRHVITKQDLVKRGEVSAQVEGRGMLPSEYFILPRKGVFRVSKLGFVDKVLGMQLSANDIDADEGIELEGGVVRVLPTMSAGDSAIAVIKKDDEGTKLSIKELNKNGRHVDLKLPDTILPNSVLALNDGTFVYVDGGTGEIARTTKNGSRRLWNLREQVPKSDLFESRVISIDP